MPGTNAGTGQPIWFRCARCRRVRDARREYTLTGWWRERLHSSVRVAAAEVEYKCGCGHVGRSRHIDLVRRAVREGVIPSGAVVHLGKALVK